MPNKGFVISLVAIAILFLAMLGILDNRVSKIKDVLGTELRLSLPEMPQGVPLNEAMKAVLQNQKDIFTKLEAVHEEVRGVNKNLLAPKINVNP